MSPSSGLERCAVLLLAAGLSRRFGSDDKLLAPWHGRPLLAWTAATLATTGCAHKVAVVGPSESARVSLLEAAGFQCVINPEPSAGMGSSIACGAAFLDENLPEAVRGVFLCLGDMPQVPLALYARLHACLMEDSGLRIALPTHAGRRGHPVLFARGCLAELRQLAGDEGARSVVKAAGARVREVPWPDTSVLLDFDTPEDFAR